MKRILITSEEAGKLEELIARCRKKTGMDVRWSLLIMTAAIRPVNMQMILRPERTGNGQKSQRCAVSDLYGQTSSYGGEGYVSTTGNMIRILTDQRIEQIQDDVAYSLKTRDYAGRQLNS